MLCAIVKKAIMEIASDVSDSWLMYRTYRHTVSYSMYVNSESYQYFCTDVPLEKEKYSDGWCQISIKRKR